MNANEQHREHILYVEGENAPLNYSWLHEAYLLHGDAIKINWKRRREFEMRNKNRIIVSLQNKKHNSGRKMPLWSRPDYYCNLTAACWRVIDSVQPLTQWPLVLAPAATQDV